MLSILGTPGKLCDRASRRELLTVGGLSLMGWGLPELLSRQALAAQAPATPLTSSSSGFGKTESVILVYLQGSPSHIDLWDPKPDAPAEIRGEFKPIPTTAPGMMLGEVLPMLAQQAKHFSLVRSIGVDPKGLRNHGAAIYMLMTGHDPGNFTETGLAVPPSREDLPSVGSMYENPKEPIKLSAFTLPGDMSLSRLQTRVDLRGEIDQLLAADPAAGSKGFNPFFEQALSLIQSGKAIKAFKMEEEAAALRERYGQTTFGQSCLLARRLIEAGTRFVQVTWPARSDDEPMPGADGSWDTHRNNFPMLRDHRCPVFDRSLSGLIEDLAARGMLEKTMVVAIGEFGRSPKIGVGTTNNVGPGGRDHWPECYSFLIAGGGVRPGQVYGESDRHGAWPKVDRVHPYDLIATMHHALGIDPQTQYLDTLRRPRRLVERGKPILGLF